MANTKTGIFDIENQAYLKKLSEMMGDSPFSQRDIDEKIKQLDDKKSNTSVDHAAQKKALEDWNNLKNLNDAYQEYLKEKANAEKGLMAQFGFYPGDNKFDSIEFKLGDGSSIKMNLEQTEKAFKEGGVLADDEKFAIAMPLNSTMTLKYPGGPKGEKGEVLEFSPGNTVKAKFEGSNMQVDEFCKQTLLNWEKEKQRTGKSEPIFLDFSTIPPDAQPGLKRRVAQTLIDMQADSNKFLSLETRQEKRDELIMAITNVSKDGKPAAFSQHDLKELGVDFSGKTNWFNKDKTFSNLKAEFSEKLGNEQKQRGFDNLINPVVEAFKLSKEDELIAKEPVVKDLVDFFKVTKGSKEIEDPVKFQKYVEDNFKHLTRDPSLFGIRKGYAIPVEQLHEAWKEVNQASLANQVSPNSSRAPSQQPPKNELGGRHPFTQESHSPTEKRQSTSSSLDRNALKLEQEISNDNQTTELSSRSSLRGGR